MTSPSSLGLETANPMQGLELIPAGTKVDLMMKIKAGNVGIENLLTRSARGDAELLNCEFTVLEGPHKGRKIFSNWVLDGTSAGHAKAQEITRSFLRAIFESAHGIDPKDNTPVTTTKRANATLAGFNGACFSAIVAIDPGRKLPDGSGNYKDKNILGKILRPGDDDYRHLDQPPPSPVERSSPPAPSQTSSSPGATTPASHQISKPSWAE